MQRPGSPSSGHYAPPAARRRSVGPGRPMSGYYPNAYGGGPVPRAPPSDDYSSSYSSYGAYDESMSAPDLSNDFRRMSMGPPPRPEPRIERGRDPYERDRAAAAAAAAAARMRDRSAPGPEISYGQRARSIPRHRSPGAESAPGPVLQQQQQPPPRGYTAGPAPYPQSARHGPSASLDRTSRYNPRGYHYSGPAPGYSRDREEAAPYPDERSRGILMPARTPRRGEIQRRSSSSGTKGHATAASVSGDMVRANYTASNAAPAESMALTAPNLARRSKSVSVRGPQRERPVINGGATTAKSTKSQSTAVRLDLGGRELDIAVKDPNSNKRRGPAIGSITINQNPAPKKEEAAPAPPAPASEPAPTLHSAPQSARLPPWEARRKLNDLASRRGFTDHGSVDSESSDEYSSYEREFRAPPRGPPMRARSASVGNSLYGRRPQPLQLGPAPAPAPIGPLSGGPIPITANGGELRHTRISRKIVTREALEELNYEYEDTGATFTVFKILRPEEIDNLMDLTARIRAARHDSRSARSQRSNDPLEYLTQAGDTISEPGFPLGSRHIIPPYNARAHAQRPQAARQHSDDMPGAWPVGGGPGPAMATAGHGGLRENPDLPGTYTGYARGPPMMPRDRGYYR